MRNLAVIILFVFMLAGIVFGGVYSGGAGEPNDPFIIATANDLQQISYEPNDWDKCFKMVADVNLAELGRNFDIIAGVDRYSYFSGVFDGNGHTISNFKCDACDVPETWRRGGVGVFYSIYGEAAEVKDLGIINADVNGLCDDLHHVCATLAGSVDNGAKITNCYAENCKVENGRGVGGLVGSVNYGIISNCYTTWDVTGTGAVGGLACGLGGVMSNCYTTGNITGGGRVGGLVAGFNGGLIADCYTTGDLNGVGFEYYEGVGGLIGYMEGYYSPDEPNNVAIQRCYSTGTVSGCSAVGGLIGSMAYCRNLKIVDSYATGDVNVFYVPLNKPLPYDYGDIYAGGLIGLMGQYYCRDNEIINCYAAGDVNLPLLFVDHGGNNYAGGLIGAIPDGYRHVIKDCYATGDVSLTGNGDGGDLYVANETYSGGLIGYSYGAGIANCYATGDVEGISYVGGLVGWYVQYCRDCIITNSYAIADVNGIDHVGGFAGYAAGEITNCYSAGKVYGENNGGEVNSVGGFVGLCEIFYNEEIINDCFWDVEASGMAIGVGFVEGDLSGPLDIQGKSTVQMKSDQTFTDAGWDFINVWGIGEKQTYPYLRQYSAADISGDGVVNFADFAILAENWLQ